ncbi:hypothetical protein HH214_10200 [Mucilaginibacter robiniae]|uniref:Uncharacterized protein n=1 Tax=Mucilaginibacter robiniae TaxID=2728022 RepID=A0A7L5DZK2_9SPHI|nr:contractile injection system tape measure protein [Mucilaginibacter robiniae]QJD96211.1 hypothetical protein HH214_10200 [Mucilaginibacter robiniae]
MSYYSIGRQMFDVNFSQQSQAHQLQDKLSKVFNQQLTHAITSLFDRLIAEDIILQIDQLVIDAGRVDYNDIEKDLTSNIIAALERELTIFLNDQQNTPLRLLPSRNNRVTGNYISVIEYFLLYGTLPWWSRGLKIQPVEDILIYLYQAKAADLKALLLQIGRYDTVQKRMAMQLPVEHIKELIKLLEPGDAEFIFRYHHQITLTQQKQSIIHDHGGHFEKIVWRFILNTLLPSVSGYFNRKMFVKANIAQLAAYYNVSYQELLNVLYNASKVKYIVVGQLELLSLVDNLWEEDCNEKNELSLLAAAKSLTGRTTELYDHLQAIHYYLKNGSLPGTWKAYDKPALNKHLMEAINQAPRSVSAMLDRWEYDSMTAENAISLLNTPGIISLITLKEPSHAEFLIHYQDMVVQAHHKQQLVSVPQQQYADLVWTLILNYVFDRRGSEFNRKSFLESNLHGIARHYNIKFQDLISSLKEMAKGTVYTPFMDTFFSVLTQLSLTDSRLSQPKSSIESNEPIRNTNQETASAQQLRDVLIYWLNYQKLPWWYRHQHKQVQAIFADLLHKGNRQYLIHLLKFAGSSATAIHLLIEEIAYENLLKAINYLPDGNSAVTHSNDLFSILSTTLIRNDAQHSTLKKILLHGLLAAYNGAGYQSFATTTFLDYILTQVTNWFTIKKSFIHAAISNSISKNIVYEYWKPSVTTLAKEAENYHFTGVDLPVRIREWITAVLGTYQTVLASTARQSWFEQELLHAISVYLTYDELPLSLIINGISTDEAIRYIITLLWPDYRMQIYNLLRQAYHLTAQEYVHRLIISAAGNINANTQSPDNARAPATAGYLNQTTNGLGGNNDWVKKLSAKLPDTAINWLNGATAEHNISKASANQTYQEQLLRALIYFLNYGKLPPGLSLNQQQTDAFLQYIVTALLSTYRIQIQSSFEKSANIQAKMRLHNIFALAKGRDNEQVKAFLETYLGHDLLMYLKHVAPAYNSDMREDFLQWLQLLPEGHPAIKALWPEILHQPSMLNFIRVHYSDEQVYRLLVAVHQLSTGMVDFLKDIQRILSALTNQSDQNLLSSSLRGFNLKYLLSKGNHISYEEYIQYLFKYFDDYLYMLSAEQMKSAIHNELNNMVVTANCKQVLPLLQNQLQKELVQIQSKADVVAELNKLQELPPIINREDMTNELNQTTASSSSKEELPAFSLPDNQSFAITNAGLVILHPFLSVFFSRLGMTTNGAFIDHTQQQRAVHLLQYLVDGTTDKPEEDLLLNKVMAGLPPEETIPARIELTATEINTTTELFKVLFTHWDKMKNASVENFRASFLQRNGTLIFQDGIWQLSVEPRGYDILLQTLPWGLNMVKAAWMKTMLTIEWRQV